MMKLAVLVVVLGVLSGGCAVATATGEVPAEAPSAPVSDPAEPVVVEPTASTITLEGEFSELSREIIGSAFEEWLSFGATFGTLTVVSVAEPMLNADGTGKHWAWYSSKLHRIYIAQPDRDADKLYISALHEFGHAAGLQDHHSGFGILGDVEWSSDMPSCISSDDLVALGLEVAGDYCTRGRLL